MPHTQPLLITAIPTPSKAARKAQSMMERSIMLALSSSILVAFLSMGCERTPNLKPSLVDASAASDSVRRPIGSTAFFGGDHLWVITDDGNVLLTENAGASWERIASGIGMLKQLSFLNDKRGWGVNNKGQVFFTGGSGRSWRPLKALDYSKISIVGPITQIRGLDERNAWILDPFSIWLTTDGGVSWDRSKPSQSEHAPPVLACQ